MRGSPAIVSERARRAERVPLRDRRRIWAAGIAAVLAIAMFGALGARPLGAGRDEDRDVRNVVLVLQDIADFRTALTAWQVFVEPHFTNFSAAAVAIDPAEVATAAGLAEAQSTQAQTVIKVLRAIGLASNAREIATANVTYTKAIAGLAPLYGGASPALIASTLAAERDGFARMFSVTAKAADQLREQTARGLQAAVGRLESGRRMFVIAAGIAAVLVAAGAFAFGQRARSREHAARGADERQAFETRLQDAFDMAASEPDAYGTMAHALRDSVPHLQVEMLVADSSRAHFHQTLRINTDEVDHARSGCGVVSPFDCPATRRGHTLVFASSSALDACPYLKGRPSGELAAACVPVSITGQASGVVHATGPDGAPPTTTEIGYLELTSRRASDRIAMLRAFEKSEAQARTDPLTGLWNRRSLENHVNDLYREGTAYVLAYGDLDNFKTLNDTHGHEAGDQALRLFSKVLRDSMRPSDITARYGGEEFVVVLPECAIDTAVKILERLRERLALTLTSGRVPSFTVSFGLASSVDADTFDAVVAAADQALLAAKANGRNRTVLAMDTGSSPSVAPALLPSSPAA